MLKKTSKGMNGRLQGIIIGIVVSSFLFVTMAFASQEQTISVIYNNIKIVVDGKTIQPVDGNGNSVEPFIYNGTTYLPVRVVAEAVGKTVTWDGKTSTVYLGKTDGQTTVENLTNLPVFKGEKLNFGSKAYTDNTGVVRHPSALMTDGKSCTYLLNTKYSRLKGNVSLSDITKNANSTISFTIYGDDKVLFTSKTIGPGYFPQDFDLDVSGVVQLRLDTTRCSIGYSYIILSGLDLYN